MNDTLREGYKSETRYDLVKFRFRTIDPDYTIAIQDSVMEVFEEFQARHHGLALRVPKFTALPPSPAKPNGLYIVELLGFAAEAVYGLPSGWMQHLTYAHVKSFAQGMTLADIKSLQMQMINSSGRRGVTLIQGGTAGRSKKGVQMPSVRVGSRKSDLHFIIYGRPNQVPGFESRWTGEGLASRTLDVYDALGGTSATPNREFWEGLKRVLGRDGADQMFIEMAIRGIELEDHMHQWSRFPSSLDQQMMLSVDANDSPPDWRQGEEY
jgi:hypothetical protein